ncbi:FAD dependent oxidoreductase-like protein superfamily [Trichodelitschia bisporula]|uniref:FAD dependent oxidoreductase-like protein superfamily n=1 Tax=Trichodelitschia bisporula TaxID=703511 RepID=A0A6G1HK11_9PEZI|nr:FAD dependent oxidoreductase-like protein superfamily [Trichodelitschia bisporula]
MENTVIIGGGIIGFSTAFYLSESPHTDARTIHVVEVSRELFNCASGLAGGFLASDWFSPSVSSLGALSFRLHKELAEQHEGREKWGYSMSTGTSLESEGGDAESAVGGSGEDFLRNGTSRANAAGLHEFKSGEGPAWLTRAADTRLEVISQPGSVAQIDPKRLCQFLLEQCSSRGVQLHQPAQVISVSPDTTGAFASVRILSADGVETDLPCTRLVIAAGAWTRKVFAGLFPSAEVNLPISALAGHSILVKSPRWSKEHETSGCHAIFATDVNGFSPEIFSRLGEEVYIAGLNSSSIPLPELPTDVEARPEAIEKLKGVAAKMLGLSDDENDIQILREGLCFRPVCSTGRPVIARVPDEQLGDIKTREGTQGGVFVAAGHGAWGISHSLGTGKLMTELLEGQKLSADIKRLTTF